MNSLVIAFLLSVTSQAPTIQQQIDAAIVGPERFGRTVKLPAGDIILTDTIRITSCAGLSLIGESKTSTRFIWNGPVDKPVFLLDDTWKCNFKDFSIVHYTSCSSVFEIINGAGNQYIPTDCYFEDILVGSNQPRMDYCFNIYNPESRGNNELHSFERCNFTGYKKSAVRIHGSQIHKLLFIHCQMLGDCGPETIGVDCEYGAYIHWIGGSGGYNKKWDFRFQNFVIANKIDGWNSEGSGGLVEVLQNGSNPAPLTVVDCRWEGKTNGGAVVAGHNPGPLTMTGNVISDASGNPTVLWTNYGGLIGGQLHVRGNAIYAKQLYNKIDRKFIVADATYDVHYSGNSFYSLTAGDVNPNRGDQDVLTNGFPVATKDQQGVVTTVAQEFSGNKSFLCTGNPSAGLDIRTVSSDGRMSIGSKTNDARIQFWNRFNQIDLAGNVHVTGVLGVSQPWLGIGPNIYAGGGGTNAIRIKGSGDGRSPNSVMDLWTTRYAMDQGPRMRYTSTSHEFIVNDGSNYNTFNPGIGTSMLKVATDGVQIGGAKFTPQPDGDVLIRLGTKQKLLSQLLD